MTTNARHLQPLSHLACEEAFDLLGAYALDALDAGEQAAVAAHLARCPRCQAELDRMEGVVGLLGTAPAPLAPPPALRTRLLDELHAVQADPAPSAAVPSGVAPPPAPVPLRPRGVVLSRMATAGLALVASILLVGFVGAGVLLHRAQGERDHAQQGQREVAEYLQNGGSVAALVPVTGAGNALGAGRGSLIVAPNQPKALIVVYGLPSALDGGQYRVWVARNGQRTNVAKLSVDDDGAGWLIVSTPRPLVSYDAVGVSLVRDGTPTRDLLTVPIPHRQGA